MSTVVKKKSIEKLSSPDSLDELMTVTSPKGWLSLIALLGLLVMIIIWSIVGSVMTKVSGRGVILKPESIANVSTLGGGRVKEIRVKPGSEVKKGDVIAVVAQPELVTRIAAADAELHDLKSRRVTATAFSSKDMSVKRDYLEKKRRDIYRMIEILQAKIQSLGERITTDEKLLQRGLLTKQDVDATRENYSVAEHEMESYKSQIKQIDIELLTHESQKVKEGDDINALIEEAEHKLEVLQNQLEVQSLVNSPFSGTVLEVEVKEGQLINVGESIASLSLSHAEKNDLEALIYIPVTEGKKIKKGMKVKVAPSTVKIEEYGYIAAEVVSVSEFPTTYQAMLNSLGNKQMVDELIAGNGAMIAVSARLYRDTATFSGFAWTSSRGPDSKISPGTFCVNNIILEEKPPITLVLPLLKEKLGVKY